MRTTEICLHVGLPADQVDRFRTEFVADGHRPWKHDYEEIGRGSWEQWYEEPWNFNEGGEPEMEEGHHVMVYCDTIPEALRSLARLIEEGYTLVPMRFENQQRCVASITKGDEHSEEFLHLRTGWAAMPTPETD